MCAYDAAASKIFIVSIIYTVHVHFTRNSNWIREATPWSSKWESAVYVVAVGLGMSRVGQFRNMIVVGK